MKSDVSKLNAELPKQWNEIKLNQSVKDSDTLSGQRDLARLRTAVVPSLCDDNLPRAFPRSDTRSASPSLRQNRPNSAQKTPKTHEFHTQMTDFIATSGSSARNIA